MFSYPKRKSALQIEIDRVSSEMFVLSPENEKYKLLLEIRKDLQKMRADEKPARPSPDVVIQSVAYILGITMIIKHEEINVITSKALSFVPRIR